MLMRHTRTYIKQVLVFGFILLSTLSGCSKEKAQADSTGCSNQLVKLADQNYETGSRLPVLTSGKWGFINKTGRLIIRPQFSSVDSFYERRAAVKFQNSKWSFIDENGSLIANRTFQYVRRFSNQRAAIKIDKQWGFIDENGRVVIKPQFSNVAPFLEERAFVQTGYLWGIIDINGNFIVKPRFSSYTNFSEGLAAVGWIQNNQYKTGFIDRSGRIVVELNGVIAETEGVGFRNGLIPIRVKPFFTGEEFTGSGQTRDRELQGFVNRDGVVSIPPRYKAVLGFENCLASVEIQDKWGLINTNGDTVIQPQFKEPLILRFGFFEGLAVARLDKKYGYIDRNGKFVIKPQFYNAEPFGENLAAVKLNEGEKWGFIDKTGNFVIKPQFDRASRFVDGIAKVEIKGKLGYIDRTAKYIWLPTK